MARIRTIKPEFFTSEDICDLTAYARLLYIALWTESDRNGRFLFKPKTFKIRYFPTDEIDVGQLLDELLDMELIVQYGEDGQYAYIPTFNLHQHVNPREAASTLPSHEGEPEFHGRGRVDQKPSRVADASTTGQRRVADPQVGREGKGRSNTCPNADAFVQFWTAYPKRVQRGRAEKIFAKLNPGAEELAQIVAAIAKQKTSDQWVKEGGAFIPHPSTWLNDKRWLDETSNAGQLPGLLDDDRIGGEV